VRVVASKAANAVVIVASRVILIPRSEVRVEVIE